nr:PREDICTED: uncharacterized protein LOC109037155 [Bemisia tabaci]
MKPFFHSGLPLLSALRQRNLNYNVNLSRLAQVSPVGVLEDLSTTGEIRSLLMSDSSGRYILQCYAKSGKLTYHTRKTLVANIIDYELRDDPDKRLDQTRFLELAQAIVEIFPTENADLYYYPATTSDNAAKRCARGKLRERYNNVRKAFQESGLIPSRKWTKQ